MRDARSTKWYLLATKIYEERMVKVYNCNLL
jgi:hypothetical protein